MAHSAIGDPALTVALALAAGMLAQALARHLRIPGIVLLLATGILLGPEALNLVRPHALGVALEALVGFAVAIILFEGAMSLKFRELAREGGTIRRLVTVGAAVTAVGGTLCARWFLGWSWASSLLFGTLVIVTGPTVIQPLLRRIRVKPKLATLLEAEGVFGDAIGAVVAVLALELALSPSGETLTEGIQALATRVGLGALIGLVGGALVALLLRRERLVPEGLENVFTLSLVLALFQISNWAAEESGIVAVTVAGLAVGNIRTPALADLREFKEQLTVLFIGLLFVLLAAHVELSQVRALGWPGIWTVLALMLVVRPLNVLASTAGSDLKARERVFLAWLAPRGIVAAAVSSLFALRLEAAGVTGGGELQAMVFLVIAATVVVQGLSGGLVATLLGVRRPPEGGWAILGANSLARALARILRDGGERLVLIDSNPRACAAAEAEGFRVVYGSALAETVLLRAGMDERQACLALTSNDGVNFAFARRARLDFRIRRAWIVLDKGQRNVTPQMIRHIGAHLLFGRERFVELWALRCDRATATMERWRRLERGQQKPVAASLAELDMVLPLALRRDGRISLVDEASEARPGDELYVLVFKERRDEAETALADHGWGRIAESESRVGMHPTASAEPDRSSS